MLQDVLAAFDRWGEWKRMREAPARIDELERRLAAIEGKPRPAPGKECKACGEPAARRTGVEPAPAPFGMLGAKNETWTCSACGDVDVVMVEK